MENHCQAHYSNEVSLEHVIEAMKEYLSSGSDEETFTFWLPKVLVPELEALVIQARSSCKQGDGRTEIPKTMRRALRVTKLGLWRPLLTSRRKRMRKAAV